ncbi:MAG: hypothetical protein U9N76_06390 [Candidatus Marinimicrobia bacterium]|nr:hypothetical protein [Candidatus Neomarinimicrobiota bacterium]
MYKISKPLKSLAKLAQLIENILELFEKLVVSILELLEKLVVSILEVKK